MKRRLVVLRRRAEQDIADALDHYAEAGGEALALRFIEALRIGLQHVAAHPATGSPRYALELDLPGLRFWTLSRFPWLIFYVERGEHLDVWRVLHGRRDIAAWLQEPDVAGDPEG